MEEMSTDRKMQLVASWQMSHPPALQLLHCTVDTEERYLSSYLSLQVNFLLSLPDGYPASQEVIMLYKLEHFGNF